MRHEEFMSRMLRPTYVHRMASGKDNGSDQPMARGARTAMARAQRQIDDLVLERALSIADERRCASVREVGMAAPTQRGGAETRLVVRCEYQRGHGRVSGPVRGKAARIDTTAWDHAAPKANVYWNDEGEQ